MYLKNIYAGFFSTPVKPINFWPFIHTGHPCSPSILNGHRLNPEGLHVLIACTNGTLAHVLLGSIAWVV